MYIINCGSITQIKSCEFFLILLSVAIFQGSAGTYNIAELSCSLSSTNLQTSASEQLISFRHEIFPLNANNIDVDLELFPPSFF